MSEKREAPEASESKEDKKALFFLLENAYLLPFSSLPCPLSSPLEFYRIKERENPRGSTSKQCGEPGTWLCIQTHQQGVKNSSWIKYTKLKRRKNKAPETHNLPFMEGLKSPHSILHVMKYIPGLDLHGREKNN